MPKRSELSWHDPQVTNSLARKDGKAHGMVLEYPNELLNIPPLQIQRDHTCTRSGGVWREAKIQNPGPLWLSTRLVKVWVLCQHGFPWSPAHPIATFRVEGRTSLNERNGPSNWVRNWNYVCFEGRVGPATSPANWRLAPKAEKVGKIRARAHSGLCKVSTLS